MQKIKQKIVINRQAHDIDATGKVLGRLATHIATLLRGKNKPTFQPHSDGGDIVVVHHAKDITLTGQKANQKVYHHHSGYPGGLKTEKIAAVIKKNPGEILRRAVYQMLPDIRLRKGMMKRLTIHNE